MVYLLSMANDLIDKNIPDMQLLALSGKKRLDYILDHKAPLKLVRSLPTTDLLTTIRDLGFESSLELVEFMSPEQVQELFDLELWAHDDLDLIKSGNYFSLLFAANKETAIKQIHGLDIELIGLMFATVSQIYDTTLGEEPDEFPSLYSMSPDGRFIVCFYDDSDKKGLAISLHAYLENLYGRDLTHALRLLESLRFELPSGLLESCLRWRQNRLLDMGILPREERLAFFAPLSIAEIKKIASQKRSTSDIPATALGLVVQAKVFEHHIFLHRALAQCTPQEQEIFLQYLQHATINMHASLSGDFGDKEAIKHTGEYVLFLLELGLCHLCQGHVESAASYIKNLLPTYIIRLGRTLLVSLRRRLVALSQNKTALLGKDFRCADSPLREVARALSLPEPRYYEGLLDVKKLTVRFFRTISEFNATVSAVNELVFRALLVGQVGCKPALAKDDVYAHADLLIHHVVSEYLKQGHMFEGIRESSGELKKEFKDFAQALVNEAIQDLAEQSSQQHDMLKKRAYDYMTALFIQLEQNPIYGFFSS